MTKGKHLILCDCLGSQKIDAAAISNATGLGCSRVHTALCTHEINSAAKALRTGDALIACAQEQPRFEELAFDIGVQEPQCFDLRDRAGWGIENGDATAKMAALAAAAVLPQPKPKLRDITSQGQCLIIGAGAAAMAAAEQLSDALSITLLLTDDSGSTPQDTFDVIKGQLHSARGSFANFTIQINAFQTRDPGGRGIVAFTEQQDGATSQCDIILDLTGNPPLFPAPEKRDGYLRADPKHAPSVAKAIFDAAQMVGTFEKPLYVQLEPSLCAHSRAEKAACSNCLDACPTGAITSAGDHVAIDPLICAGCGACAALCPSGAIAYDAPAADAIFRHIETLARTFRNAGGENPRLLVHDDTYGTEMIALAARFGRGLPADVIPMDLSALAGFGHAEMLAAFGAGFADLLVLVGPKSDQDTIAQEAALATALSGRAVSLLDMADPDALSDYLYAAQASAAIVSPILPLGTRRQVARTATKALQTNAIIPLPDTAPYGAVLVDADACTLCLSCVSLCPSGALADNPDMPQLRFQEDACLQCGLCSNICPENAITLEPRMNLTDSALAQVVLNEEEPFACITCGSLFGVKSTIEKITEKLAGKHAMFANPDTAKMIQMCDSCRIQAQYHATDNPFTAADRPAVRTTDDYLSKRRDH
ncbi:(4Fe-4S)-binding protein [Loktanella sp. D2R18]|uniref:4Fe-4S binding protein n=1 Tax=Rhodobacterales TaxID=204455 RepID=UPI000DEB81C7|nr:MULTISPECIES: 4Fe-4S binding protein [Rhodobacterales]MDO6591525.1 4Fe-4S binding protein [Yoonia sp. 1_MG-2023]RBW43840.1 (4Fe-4S)-binding protein [Loktanella sp. D2R18]